MEMKIKYFKKRSFNNGIVDSNRLVSCRISCISRMINYTLFIQTKVQVANQQDQSTSNRITSFSIYLPICEGICIGVCTLMQNNTNSLLHCNYPILPTSERCLQIGSTEKNAKSQAQGHGLLSLLSLTAKLVNIKTVNYTKILP